MLKRIISMVLSFVIILGIFITAPNTYAADFKTSNPRGATYSGACGDNVTWSLDTSTSTLTISGSGAMTNYNNRLDVPWSSTTYRFNIRKVIINQGVTSIGDYAFCEYPNLTSITIPSSIKSIGYYSFAYCISLTKITIPSGITSIDDYAFRNCAFTSITIPNSVESIGAYAFMDCNLKSITLSENLTSIEGYTFWNCGNLKSITIPKSVTSIGDHAFASCITLTDITIPNSITTIEDSAFWNCESLESITIPESVTFIGKGVFAACKRLTNINVDSNNKNYLSLDGVLFNIDKTNIMCYPASKTAISFTIPDGVVSIDGYTFRDCTKIANIVIPNSVTFIGSLAFENCSRLVSVIIPSSISEMEYEIFRGCNRLHLLYAGSWEQWSVVADYTTTSPDHYDVKQTSLITKTITPTCAEYGYDRHFCPICNVRLDYDDNYIDPLGHNYNPDGICETCDGYVQSSHPYARNCDETWTINKPNAKQIAITFSANTKLTKDTQDFIRIYDRKDNLIGEYSGVELASQRIVVNSDTIKIRLVSDSNTNEYSTKDYGFSLTNIEAIFDDTDTVNDFDTDINTETDMSTDSDTSNDTESKKDTDTSTDTSSDELIIIPNETDTDQPTDTDTEQEGMTGDIDGDGEISMLDVVILQKSIARLIEFTPEQVLLADVNNDGKTTMEDVVLIQKFIAKLIDSF